MSRKSEELRIREEAIEKLSQDQKPTMSISIVSM